MFSLPTKKQWLSVLKAVMYVSVSAGLDYLISISIGTTFGFLTAPINGVLVIIKKLFTSAEK